MRQTQRQPGYYSKAAQESRRAVRELKQFHNACVEVHRNQERSQCASFWDCLAKPTDMLVLYFAVIEVTRRVLIHVNEKGNFHSRFRVSKKEIEAMSHDASQMIDGSTIESLRDLAAAAQSGDQEAFRKLKMLVGEGRDFWDHFNNLDDLVQSNWIELFTGQNLCSQEGIRRDLKTLCDELSESDDGPIERLGINRVKMAWLQAMYIDNSLRALGVLTSEKESNRLAKRSEHANRQFQEALQSLASIRTLGKS